MSRIAGTFSLFFLMLSILSCKSPPKPPESPPPKVEEAALPEAAPLARLKFDRIEAASTFRVSLFYTLSLENPGSRGLTAEIPAWEILLDGKGPKEKKASVEEAAALFLEEDRPAGEASFECPAAGSSETPLRLDVDLSRFPGWDSVELTEYTAEFRLKLSYRHPEGKDAEGEAVELASFPRIREPEFTITRIAVLQAELINTRFRVNLKIDNPNFFPVDLSSFEYALFGDGRFWADGMEKNVLHIPAGKSEETRLFLTMNFINQRRDMLDRVMDMDPVRYRFAGDVLVETGVAWLPQFRMGFDKSGYSEVFE
ncbi:MAG: LEA type 2 family protein [Treponema sp.]|jgi:LEA14-like dessication related protein|nr:LEA type 2 family protein [Treponema sp.]